MWVFWGLTLLSLVARQTELQPSQLADWKIRRLVNLWRY